MDRRSVGGRVDRVLADLIQHLANQRRLADLARPHDDLQEPSWLQNPVSQGVGM
jgi:hypothetical protein